MIMVDKFFTHQEYVQAEGRMARKGQTRPCTVHEMNIENTCDTWMASVAGSKGMASSTIFARRGGRAMMLLEEGEDVVPGQDVLEVPAEALSALERLQVKGEEKAKKTRERNLEKRLAPPQKAVSPKQDPVGGSDKRQRDDGGDQGQASRSQKSKASSTSSSRWRQR